MKSFSDFLAGVDRKKLKDAIDRVRPEDVAEALSKDRFGDRDAVALFSPAASEFLEPIARRSAAVTERRFGKVIQLYAPLYLSNECANICLYCGFSADVKIPRISLSTEQAVREAGRLHEEGFRHVLLVTGEFRRRYDVDRIEDVVRRLGGRFASISIEVFPMEVEEYKSLTDAGVDGLTLYQETYDPAAYEKLHPKGTKRNFANRVRAIEKGGEAGFRSLGVGALLGLADWRVEGVLLAWHARYLTRRFWQSRIAISFPRVNPNEADFEPPCSVSDADLLQIIVGMRLLLPDAELVLSTREGPEFRDRLVGLGVTRMSAGSKTSPGAYTACGDWGKQFDVADGRSASEVARMIASRGFEPVWKDFDPAFLQESN